jgi:methionyl aminopeptidase
MAWNASWVAFVQIAPGSAIMAGMSVNLKTPQEIEMMRIAGRLASEVLDIVTPHVKPGVTTGNWTASATTTS